MASKRRLRRRSCTGKIRYKTETEAAAAAAAAKSLRRRRGERTSWYECRFCNGWHVGRPSKKRVKAIRDSLNSRGR